MNSIITSIWLSSQIALGIADLIFLHFIEEFKQKTKDEL